MADPVPSEKTPPVSDPTPAKAGDEPTSAPSKVDAKAFANTRQHVASRQADGGAVERFTNTKLNIALINDPKNGPRFTMTKRESGLSDDDGDGDGRTSDAPETAEGDEEAATAESGGTAKLSKARSPSTSDMPASGDDASSETEKAPADDKPAEAAEDKETETEAASAPVAKLGMPGTPPGAEPPSKLPIDSSKTFVGPNGTYYDESWRWMDWRGTRRSWNWPAALSLGHWFAYRRLYVFAGLHLLWLAGLVVAAVNAVPILAVILAGLLGIAVIGLYGNSLYFLAFRRAVDHVTQNGEGSYEERHDQLAAAGGTNAIASAWMGVLSVAAIVTALIVTKYLRGGLAVSFWPFF